MTLQVPNIAAAEHDPRRREISRAYRRNLDSIDNKPFVGPPETTVRLQCCCFLED
jgi:hypothetical protein